MPPPLKKLKTEEESLSETLENLRTSKELTDVVIKCSGGNLEAHQLILSVRSPIFRKMFSADFKESQSNEVDFSHIKMDIVQCILEYIYSNSTENISQLPINDVLNTFQASHMLELSALTDHCWKLVMDSVSVENYVQIWNASLLYKEERDTECVIEFVLENLEKIHDQNKFSDLAPAQIKILLDKIKQDNVVVGNNFLQDVLEFNCNGKLPVEELEEFLLRQNLDYISTEFMTQLLDREKSSLSDEFFRRFVEKHVLPTLNTRDIIDPPKYRRLIRSVNVKILRFSCDKKIDNDYLFNENACIEIVDVNNEKIETRQEVKFLFGFDVFIPIHHHRRLYLIGCTLKRVMNPISSQCFISFDWKTNHLMREHRLLHPVKNPHVCCIEETIYIIENTNERSAVVQIYSNCNSNEAVWRDHMVYNIGWIIDCVNFGNILHFLCYDDSAYFLQKYIDNKIVMIDRVPIPKSDNLLMTVYENKIFIFYLSDIPRLSRCSVYDSSKEDWLLEPFHGFSDTSINPSLKIAAVVEEGILFSECKNDYTNFYIFKEGGDGTLKFLKKIDNGTWISDCSLKEHGFTKFQQQIVCL